MEDDRLKILPPLYLVSTEFDCWKCGEKMPVLALLAPNVENTYEDTGNEACVLTDIVDLPDEILHFMQERAPNFKLTYSKTLDYEYYANTCPSCGILSGDFHLHLKPDGPFFPISEEEASLLILTEVPIQSPVRIDSGYHIGTGDLILHNARRKASTSPGCRS